MEKSLKEQMEGVLAVEREKNNKALTPVSRGKKVPNDVRKAKIEYIDRRISEGLHAPQAAKEAGISWHSYYAWKRIFAGKPAYKAKMKPAYAAQLKKPRSKETRPRHRYTEAQRLELVHKLRRLLKRGMSQRVASAALGLRPGTGSRWLSGQVPLSGTDRKRRPNPLHHKDNGEEPGVAGFPVRFRFGKEPSSREYVFIGEALEAYRNTVNPDDFEKELLRAIIRRG